ncbi:hypothetical protein CCYA_CCYA06G1860 [Cyanidiococcus yangmingshanensis]|uniref:Translin-associated protein X n=1 Tax=Cyanidiococcus yangmingshanensis TaxID=2690220 RepID=A0A7J7ILF0_9RHOD|nr:hypothetical protein F1559_003429 [Cyanidiococcus yangmingshanensis]KAK4531003.1 hypothetical protein CCYA_CCYA06G1860 [Cyanidiococcus yangmingshanensis]
MPAKRPLCMDEDGLEAGPKTELTARSEAEPSVTDSIPYLFEKLAAALDARLERRERFVRASRDLTMTAKKAIFDLQRQKKLRQYSEENQSDSRWAKTEETFGRLRGLVQSGIMAELDSTPEFSDSYWQYHAVFSPGIQEYVESITFYHWLRYERMLSFEEVQQQLAPFPLAVSDYVLGLCDTSGEIMRAAVQNSALGDQEISFEASEFLCLLFRECSGVGAVARRAWPSSLQQELERKLVTMGESLRKVQDVCYRICLRRAERDSLGFFGDDQLDTTMESLPD